jgi:lysophospholipase L1-like esterase
MRPKALLLVVAVALFVLAGGAPGKAVVGMTAAQPKVASLLAGGGIKPFTYVALGDSWPAGAHCGYCRTFVGLYADGLARQTGHRIRFTDLTQANIPGTDVGQTSNSLLSDLRSDRKTQQAVAAADIIVISTGANDLEAAFDAYGAGTCGGTDNSDCFRKVALTWRSNFDAILTQVGKLRTGHRKTAIRIVTNSNEFLADPNFGKDFGVTTGVLITKLMHTALCGAARAHAAVCVYLAPVLNGPNLTSPQDVNTPKAMAAVARSLLSKRLPELNA